MSAWTLSTRHGHPCSVRLAPLPQVSYTPLTLPELINVFEVFLPQLLRYPNPADPLNGEAASLLMRDPKAYAKKVESYVERYATPEDADQAGDEDGDGHDDGSDEEMAMGGKGKSAAAARRDSLGAAAQAPKSNGLNGNGRTGANGHGNGVKEEDEDDDEDGMSDMGELSDGDEIMGEMDD